MKLELKISAIKFFLLFITTGVLLFNTKAQTFQSALSIGGDVSYYDRSMVIDGDGNYVYTGGLSGTSDFDPSAGTSNLTSGGSVDIYVCKLSNTGALVWAHRIGGTGWDASSSCDVDTAGNIYVTGIFSGTVDFDPGTGTFTMNAATSLDVFILKLSPTGAFQWAKRIGSAADAEAWSIDSDQAGNTVTVGNFYGTVDINPNAGTQNVTSAGGEDIFILKLNPAGGTVWAKSIGDIGGDFLNSVRQNEAGDIFMAGYFSYTMDFDPGTGTYPMTAVSNADMFILKLTSAGIFSWAGQVPVGSLNNVKMELDDFNNVYINFTFSGTVDCDPTAGVFNLTKSTGSTETIIKMSSSGNFKYAKCFLGTGTTSSKGMDLDRLGSLYLSGFFYGTIDFNPGAGTSNLTDLGSEDGYICKLDSAGNFVSVLRIGGAPNNAIHPYNVVLGDDFRIHFDGDFFGTQDFNTGTGVANLTATSPNHTFLTVYTQCIQPSIPTFSVSDTEFCDSDTVKVKITSGNLNSATGWKWYRNSCGGILLGTGDSLEVILTSTTNIYARGEGGCVVPSSCSAASTITVYNSPVPIISVADDSLCSGMPPVNLSFSPSGGVFSGAGITAGQFDPAISGLGEFPVHYTLTDIHGCVGEDSLLMHVFDTPFISFIVSDDTLCKNENQVLLTATPAGGIFSGDGVNFGNFIPDSAESGLNMIHYEFVDTVGCIGKDSAEILVLDFTPIDFSMLDDSLCLDETSLLLSANPSGGIFSGDEVNAGFFDPVTAGPGVHEIYYQFINVSGCSSLDSLEISVFNLPILSVSVSDDSLCLNSSPEQLNGFPSGGTFSGSGVNAGNFDPSISGNGVFNIYYSYTHSDGCSNLDSISIAVFNNPITEIIISNDSLCKNDAPILLTGLPTGGTFSGPGIVAGFFDPGTVLVGLHTIYYDAIDTLGCLAQVNRDISVFELPVTTIYVSDDSLCMNSSSVQLTGTPSSGFFSGTGVSGSLFDPTLSDEGNFMVYYSFTDLNGCSNSDSLNINVDECLGIEEIEDSPILVYPNPANRSVLHLNTDFEGNYSGRILDVTGKIILNLNFSDFHSQIDISSLTAGIYFLEVEGKTKKFTVER